MSADRGGVTAGLRELLGRLQTFRVDWTRIAGKSGSVDNELEYELGIDIEESDLDLANVASSLRKTTDFLESYPQHILAIDLDVPAYLVPSSTFGHSHLYVDVKIPHHRYMALLSALADAGIIERGYADVSIKRGRSDLRLPWVQKGDPLPEKPEVEDPGPVQRLADLAAWAATPAPAPAELPRDAQPF